MNIFLSNRDSSFFRVRNQMDVSPLGHVMMEDIISFSIEEEMNKMLTGSISLYDPTHFYSRVLIPGKKLKVSWGYKSPDISMVELFDLSAVKGRGFRQDTTVIIQSPSGGGSEQGETTLNVNFYGWESQVTGLRKTYMTGTKGTVIMEVFTRMGISTMCIDFHRMKEVITPVTSPMQWESDYKFLIRCAFEWGACFRIGENAAGLRVGMFAEYDTPAMTAFTQLCGHAIIAGSVFLNYKAEPCNVRSYTWQNQSGMNGTGDNVQIIMGANGQPEFHRYNAGTQSVDVWVLQPDRIAAKFKDKSAIEQFKLIKEFMGAKTFPEVQWAFKVQTETTAPQGLGYTINAKMIGNAHVTAGIRADFGNPAPDAVGTGFPSFCYSALGGNNPLNRIKWWVTKVKHNIDRTGYNMDVDIADAFTISNGSYLS